MVTVVRAAPKRLGLSDMEFAVSAGVSLAVIRRLRVHGIEPTRAPTRRALRSFLDRAKRAATRADLGLPS